MADPFLSVVDALICLAICERHGLCGQDAAFGIHRLDERLVVANLTRRNAGVDWTKVSADTLV
jgi:hypothetical protein